MNMNICSIIIITFRFDDDVLGAGIIETGMESKTGKKKEKKNIERNWIDRVFQCTPIFKFFGSKKNSKVFSNLNFSEEIFEKLHRQ